VQVGAENPEARLLHHAPQISRAMAAGSAVDHARKNSLSLLCFANPKQLVQDQQAALIEMALSAILNAGKRQVPQ
jgi:hypothetical protein